MAHPTKAHPTKSRASATRSGLVLVARFGMLVLAALNLWWGLWARVRPAQFFDEFPGFGRQWTAAYPPYNEHLVTDLGTTFLTLAFLLAVAAVLTERKLRVVALLTVLLFNALHLAFHAGDPGLLDQVNYGASMAALIAGVLAPLVLLILDWLGRPGAREAG